MAIMSVSEGDSPRTVELPATIPEALCEQSETPLTFLKGFVQLWPEE